MPASWVNTSFYEGDDIDADGNLWGLGATEDTAARARLVDTLISVDKSFAGARGVAGTTLRSSLANLRPLIQAAINAWKANLTSMKAKAARDAAYEVLYDLDERPQTQSTQPVPDWLLDQMRDRVKKLITASYEASVDLGIPGLLFDVFGPITPEKVRIVTEAAGRAAGAAAGAAGRGLWASTPLWLKITGGVVVVGLGFAIYKLIRGAIPVASQYARQRVGIHGVRRVPRSRRLRGRR